MVTRQDLQQLCSVPRKEKCLMCVLSLGQKEVEGRILLLKGMRKLRSVHSPKSREVRMEHINNASTSLNSVR